MATVSERISWQGRDVAWTRLGSGPPVVFCHGTPFSSRVWAPYADALAEDHTVYLWDMPGYGLSSKRPEHDVSLDVQGELFADLLAHWELSSPRVVAHDYGGVVSLRAHLLHGRPYHSLALVDVVALAPWGTPYFRLVRDHAAAFSAVPAAIYEGGLRAYIRGASHRGLADADLAALAEPWLGEEGQPAFYRQIAQADQRYTDEIEPRYADLDLPVLVVWGAEDCWLPVEQAHRLAATIPGARLELIDGAGHLVQLDRPVELATSLHRWLTQAA